MCLFKENANPKNIRRRGYKVVGKEGDRYFSITTGRLYPRDESRRLKACPFSLNNSCLKEPPKKRRYSVFMTVYTNIASRLSSSFHNPKMYGRTAVFKELSDLKSAFYHFLSDWVIVEAVVSDEVLEGSCQTNSTPSGVKVYAGRRIKFIGEITRKESAGVYGLIP